MSTAKEKDDDALMRVFGVLGIISVMLFAWMIWTQAFCGKI